MEISAKDASRLMMEDGDLAHITSRQGSETFPIKISADVRPSQVFIAMHWGSEFISGNSGKVFGKGVNGLTSPIFDPVSEQPELKYAAVKILKANLPWHFVAFAYFPKTKVLAILEELKGLYAYFGSAYATLFGREQDQDEVGIFFRAANEENPYLRKDVNVLLTIEKIAQLFRLTSAESSVMGYQDSRLGAMRMVRIETSLKAVIVSGAKEHLQSLPWLKAYLEQGINPSNLGRLILAPTKKPPIAVQIMGRPICNCFHVTEDKVLQSLQMSNLRDFQTCFDYLQDKTKCGMNCGSCKPEIKKMIQTFLVNVKGPSGALA